MADLPSILGGLAQGFVDFGKGAVDMFGTGGAAIGDLIEGARTGKVTTKNQDDFRKWLYQTDSTKDAAAKGLGTALNGVQTVLDYIPGVNVLTRNPLGNAAQGALGGLADEFKTYGEDYDLGRAGQRAAVSGAAAAASGSLADALKGSSNALLSSNTLQGLARGATGGAITGGGYAAIDGGDVLEAAKQGAGMGALIGGATGAFQDFKPAKTYDVALTDDERAARIANAQKQIDDIGPIRRFTDDPNELAKRARVNELQDAIKAYQSGYDTVQDYNDALAARRANRQPSLTREEYEAKMQQRIRDLGGNYEVTPEKQAQFDRLQKVNPMRDDYHTGIRAPQDIATLQEAINNAKDIDPAYKAMLQKALADDSVTVYSSYPIEEGVFTTPIEQMAQDYAGPGNQVYSKTISPNDIAWIDDQEGNYLPRPRMMDNTGQAVPQELAERLANTSPLVRDENGNLMRFYHGTPDGSFDTFRDGSYFTPDRTYADTYQNPQASSISYGKQAVNPTTFETYLDIRKPFDISDPEARRVYIDEYIKGGNAMGINPYQDNYDDIKNIDWTEVENLSEFLRDGKYGYDALIADEGGVFDSAGNVVPRGKSYIPFSGDQVITLKKNSGISPETTKKLEKILSASEDAINNPKLTPEQEAYFKDSVIRDENGNLMPMYHGTRSNFTVFGDNAPYDTSNSHASVGNWFTPTEEGARNFAESIWYGDGDPKVMETYLNVKNPKIYESADNSKAVEELTKKLREMELDSSKLSDTELYSKNIYDASMAQRMLEQEGRDTTIKWLSGKGYGDEKAAKLVDEIAGLNEQAIKKKDLLDKLSELKYSDAYQRFKTDLYKVDGQTAEDANVGGTGMALNDRGSIKKYVDKLKSEGYDGIIIKGTKYDADVMGGPNDQYVVFDSNQIKSTNNLNPTENPDIRYSKAAPGQSLEKTLSNGDFEINRVGSANVAPVDPATLPESMRAVKGFLDKDYIKDIEKYAGKKYADMSDSELLDYALSKRKPEDRDIMRVAYEDMIKGGSSARKIAENTAKNNYLSAIGETEYSDASGDGLMEYLLSHGNQIGSDSRTKAADIELSDRLGIAPGNTFMRDNANPYDSYGSYNPYDTTISIGDKAVGENAIGTVGHERLHSFQTEALMNRYDKEVLDAYRDLSKDLDKYIKNDAEIAKLHADDPADLAYWGNKDEQQARMLQQYLENKKFTNTGRIRNRAKEWGNEINPAFDKFFDKLRDLSKRGVALPALAALFGGGAYMASQENDKEKEVK